MNGTPADTLVAVVDAGSPRNFGWSFGDCKGCGSPDDMLLAIGGALAEGRPVALGIEAPLWLPAGRKFDRMTSARGEFERLPKRAWSAGAGCGATCAGMANLTWLLEQLRKPLGGRCVTVEPGRLGGPASLLIWEAFITGGGKRGAFGHAEDAALAVRLFHSGRGSLASTTGPVVNLAWGIARAVGVAIADDEAATAPLVIGPPPGR